MEGENQNANVNVADNNDENINNQTKQAQTFDDVLTNKEFAIFIASSFKSLAFNFL